MNDIPDEWVDKLFNCMGLFYKNRWDKMIFGQKSDKITTKDYYINNLKAIWKNGLKGLGYEDIKSRLRCHKYRALDLKLPPPTVMEFFNMRIRNNTDINKSQEHIKNIYALLKK